MIGSPVTRVFVRDPWAISVIYNSSGTRGTIVIQNLINLYDEPEEIIDVRYDHEFC